MDQKAEASPARGDLAAEPPHSRTSRAVSGATRSPAATAAPRPHILAPLARRPVALLWSALAFSALGDQLCAVALSWVAVEVLGAAAGYLSAGYAAIILVVIAFGGGFADRWNRRWSMVVADALRCLVLVWFVSLWLAGDPPTALRLFGVLAALAVGEALFTPALQTILPSLIGEPRLLAAANGLFDGTARFARLLGPGLVALASPFIPVMHFFSIDAASFLISGLAIASLAAVPAERVARGGPCKVASGNLGRGFEALRGHPLLRSMLVANGIVAGTWSAAFFVALPLAITQQHVGGDGGADIGTYGLLLTCYGVANLAANVAVGSAGVPSRPGATVFLGLSLTGSGILFIACALAAPLPAGWRLPLLALATAFSGIGGPLKDITIATVRQLSVASRDMAAAMRVHLLLAYAGTLAVMLATPSLCDRLGAVTVIALVGGVFLAVAAIGWAQPSVRESRS